MVGIDQLKKMREDSSKNLEFEKKLYRTVFLSVGIFAAACNGFLLLRFFLNPSKENFRLVCAGITVLALVVIMKAKQIKYTSELDIEFIDKLLDFSYLKETNKIKK